MAVMYDKSRLAGSILLLSFTIVFLSCGESANNPDTGEKETPLILADTSFRNGDIIFQESESGQSKAIKLATHSQYTHCGILVQLAGEWKVLEAVQPVCVTSFESWIERGINSHYVVKRHKELDSLPSAPLLKMAEDYIGKDYDLVFAFSDAQMYCSELVWKIYSRFDKEICPTRKLKEFDLDHPEVKRIMKKRYGTKIPYEESVISPADLFDSKNLIEIKRK